MKKIFVLVFLVIAIVGCSSDDTIRTPPVIVFQGNLVIRTQAEVNAIGAQGYNVINGSLHIGDVASDTTPAEPSDITDLSPLSTITSITRQLEIQSNPELTSLNGFSNLAVVSGLVINDNETLTSLDGLTSLSRIDGNTILTAQTFLSGGLISLSNNPALTSISGLSSINPQVIFQISIDKTGLTTLDGLENINSITRLNITSNNSLISLEALEGLENIRNTVFIFNNDMLVNYCTLQTPLQNNQELSIYNVSDNQFNPTQQNIIDGNCSQ
ncbi:MAG: hypothetical protein AAF611_06205 [Bacteroidota bacterium]